MENHLDNTMGNTVPVITPYRGLIRFTSISTIILSILFMGGKFLAWRLTGALSVEASLMDSTLDFVGSVINFLVLTYALRPPDHDHRFGHEKLEAIAGLIQSAFIGGCAAWFFMDVLGHLQGSAHITHHVLTDVSTNVPYYPKFEFWHFTSWLKFLQYSFQKNPFWWSNGILITTQFSILMLLALQRYTLKRVSSVVIKADFAHYTADFFVNLFVLFSLNVSRIISMPWLDGMMGVVIVVYILTSAYHLGRHSLDILMDKELSKDQLSLIHTIVTQHPGVYQYHDLRTRFSGRRTFIQLHLDLNPHLTLEKAHDIADEVEERLLKAFPNGDILIHQDPYFPEETK